MTNPPSILFDCDGVLVDYMNHFIRYLSEVEGIQPRIPFSQETDYNLMNMFPDLPPEKMRPYIVAMSQNREWYESIPFMPGAENAVRTLRARFPDAYFACITAGGADSRTRQYRLKNLAPLKLNATITLPLGSSKRDVLRDFGPGSWFVDDVPNYVLEAENAGHHGILFGTNYNLHARVNHRAEGWADVVKIITAERRELSPVAAAE